MYFLRFAKKDQEYIHNLNQWILEGYREDFSSIEEKIEKSYCNPLNLAIEEFKAGKENVERFKSRLMHILYFAGSDIKAQGMLDRMLLGAIDRQISGIYTRGRLAYIKTNIKDFEYDYADCLHCYDIIDALAVRDFKVIEKYILSIPGPAKEGHKFSILLCNSLYSILKKDDKEMNIAAENIKKFNKKSIFDKALISSMLAIIYGDFAELEANINIMLKNNKKKFSSDGEQKYICLTAHGIVNLAEYLHEDSNLNFVNDIKSQYWDLEFYNAVKNNNDKLKDFYDFTYMNPILQNWITDLPIKIKLEDLIC